MSELLIHIAFVLYIPVEVVKGSLHFILCVAEGERNAENVDLGQPGQGLTWSWIGPLFLLLR